MERHVWRAGARKATEGCLDSEAMKYVHASNSQLSIPVSDFFTMEFYTCTTTFLYG